MVSILLLRALSGRTTAPSLFGDGIVSIPTPSHDPLRRELEHSTGRTGRGDYPLSEYT